VTSLRDLPVFADTPNPFADLLPPAAAPARPTPADRPGSARGGDPEVDWGLVRAFRQQAAELLAEELRGTAASAATERARGAQIAADLLAAYQESAARNGQGGLAKAQQRVLHRAVVDALFGLGRLQPLVDDPAVENIEVYGSQRVLLLYADGRIVEGPPVADSDEELIDTIAFLAARQQGNARPFSRANPILDLRLDGGARLSAIAWITPMPTVTIRLHRVRDTSLDDLFGRGMLPRAAADFLAAAVRAKLSIVVCGAMGAGKTTMVRALCAAFDPYESVATVETEYELHLHELPHKHRRVHAFEARTGGGERLADGRMSGEITLDDIVRTVWRRNVARIVVGEVRGPEVLTMLNVMSGGAGSLSTVHADSARAAIDRLVTLAMGGGPNVSAEFVRRQIGQHIDLVVHVAAQERPDGSLHRYVAEIIAVEHDGDGLAVTDLWRAEPGSTVASYRHVPSALADMVGWQR
jgi:Flp pilus assembly CpaF family ATPase